MTNDKEFIKEAKKILEYFSVDISKDVIEITSGGNSCIIKESKEYNKQFLGHSINSIIEAYALLINKKINYKN